MQNPEIMMNVKIPRITQFFHLEVGKGENDYLGEFIPKEFSFPKKKIFVWLS